MSRTFKEASVTDEETLIHELSTIQLSSTKFYTESGIPVFIPHID